MAELAVIIPVLNERDNVAALVAALDQALAGIDWEAIFVDDDSTDGTREAVAKVASGDGRVRLLHRIGRRGLSSAFIEGANASLAPFIAAMDGDLQHDERILPRMLQALREGAEIAIGSRYVEGGGVGDWDATRVGMSSFATRLSQILLKAPVADPMSGFFMIRRDTYDRAVRRLSAMGFKILLDLIASLPTPPRIVEVPYTFRARLAGESKMNASVMLDYALLLLDKLLRQTVPVRFVLFAIVGMVGLAGHLAVLRLGLLAGLDFTLAQALATAVAIYANFELDNVITFGDLRLRGQRKMRGLAIFAAICSVGAIGNLGVADFLVGTSHEAWWVGGVVGAVMSLVWNYAVGATFTWRRRFA
ncbi:MAG: glycosyltransferase family 2 protein [Rhodospirillales bacterium]|jgi:dolichol-phosphate mannosyltransferase|nr:glycosyltransferase family 2 protein [Rhodospirillales bacterium]